MRPGMLYWYDGGGKRHEVKDDFPQELTWK
jgi:hypothetical protein